MTTDVLVIGAGPVGLTVAGELLRRGVRCRLIDESDAPSQTSKAQAIHARTLEIFEHMGVVNEFLAEGLKITGANVHDGEKRILRLDLGRVKVPYPYVMSLPQSDTERLLAERLRSLGGGVERSKKLIGFGQDRDRVVAFVGKSGEGASVEEIEAGRLIGCDGAHSRVRHTLGVPFEGRVYEEEEFLLADVELDWGRSHNEAHAWLHGDGLFLSIPLPGDNRWRLIADVNLAEGEEAPQASVELFQELMAERTGDTRTHISNPTWMSNFKINRRMVTGYRRERVFLAGDAAHIHSPVGGQGMNTGLGDAFNLGWKLALVVKGEAPTKLLDTYEEERMPVARGVLRGTQAGTSMVVSRNRALRFARDQAMSRLAGPRFVQEKLFGRVSQLSVNYRGSSLSKSYKTSRAPRADGEQEMLGVKEQLRFGIAPRAGDRAPQGHCRRYPSREETSLFREMRGTGFVLLLFEGPTGDAAGYERLVGIPRRVSVLLGDKIEPYVVVVNEPESPDGGGRVLLDAEGELHEAYNARTEALYLVRPDGYIGFKSQPANEDRLLDYLGNLFLLDDAPFTPAPGRPAVISEP